MADALSPRPPAVVVAAWLAMVWSGFTLVGAFLCLVALLLLRDGLADVPFLAPLAERAFGGFVAALTASVVGVWLGSLVWRGAGLARWLLLGLVALLGVACLVAGGMPGAFFGVPLGLTALALVTPGVGRWFADPAAGRGRRRVAATARPAAVGVGCGAAVLGHGLGAVLLVRPFLDLAGADLSDHELAEFVDPTDAQTWGLALLLLFATVHLGFVGAALGAFGRSAGARVVASVGCGTGALLYGGATLQTFDTLTTTTVVLLLAAVVLLATPAANAWFRAASTGATGSGTPGGRPDAHAEGGGLVVGAE